MSQRDDMKLPDGKTCGDCAHWKRCKAFGFSDSPDNAWCDFAPNRFREKKQDANP